MPNRRFQRAMLAVFLAGGALFGGPCGITTLQFKDFLSSTLIRTGVTTVASLFEAATIDAALNQDNGSNDEGDNGGGN